LIIANRWEKALYYGHFMAYVGFNLFTSHWFSPMSMLGMDLNGQWGSSGYWIMKTCGHLMVDTVLFPEVAMIWAVFEGAVMNGLADI
jgi:hypothetical protein